MTVVGLIGIMVAVVVGIVLVIVSGGGDESSEGKNIASMLPIIFVTVIVIVAIAWMGISNGEDKDKRERSAGEVAVEVAVKDWFKGHWRLIAIVIVVLLAWFVVSLSGWNN